MIHYTCDRCKREIDPAIELHYVVQLEVKPVRDDSFAEFDDEVDHLTELNEYLETNQPSVVCEHSGEAHRDNYDLCGECYQQFKRNPLGRESGFALGFSNN